jgi:hypothetical protein
VLFICERLALGRNWGGQQLGGTDCVSVRSTARSTAGRHHGFTQLQLLFKHSGRTLNLATRSWKVLSRLLSYPISATNQVLLEEIDDPSILQRSAPSQRLWPNQDIVVARYLRLSTPESAGERRIQIEMNECENQDKSKTLRRRSLPLLVVFFLAALPSSSWVCLVLPPSLSTLVVEPASKTG